MKNCITNMHNQRQGYVQEHTCYVLDPHLNMFQDQVNRFILDTKISFPLNRGSEGQVLGTDGNNHVYWKSVLVEEAMAPLWDKEHREPYQTGDYVIYNHRLYIRLNDEDPESLEQSWIEANWQEVSVAEEFYKTREKISDVETQSIARDNALEVRIDNVETTLDEHAEWLGDHDSQLNELARRLDEDDEIINEHDERITQAQTTANNANSNALLAQMDASTALNYITQDRVTLKKLEESIWTPWETNHYYAANTYAIHNGSLYICLVSHTSDDFDEDYELNKWGPAVLEDMFSDLNTAINNKNKVIACTEAELPSVLDTKTVYLVRKDISSDHISRIIANYVSYGVLPSTTNNANKILTVNNDGTDYSWQALPSSEESDPIFTASPAAGITTTNINDWNNKSTVSGTASGANWSTITINGTTKNIPVSSSTTVIYSSDVDSQHKIAVGGITVNGGARQDIYVPQYLAGSNISITQDPTSHDYTISSTGGGGGEPSAYLKSASVSGNTLTLTNKDNSTVQFTPSGSESVTSVTVTPTYTSGVDVATISVVKNGTTTTQTIKAPTAGSGGVNSVTLNGSSIVTDGTAIIPINGTTADDNHLATTKYVTDHAGYVKPSGGIPSTDLTSAVQTSLGLANTALQSHQDISGKENISNKVTSIVGTGTDTQYPSTQAVYDFVDHNYAPIGNYPTTEAPSGEPRITKIWSGPERDLPDTRLSTTLYIVL